MAAVDDLERQAVVDHGADVPARVGDLGERRQHVEPADGARGPPERLGPRPDRVAHLLEQLVLEPPDPLLGRQDRRLGHPELSGDVPLGARERLSADVLGGHARRLRVAHLDPVAEDAVVTDPEARDTRARPLAALELADPGAGLAGPRDQLPDVVEGVALVGEARQQPARRRRDRAAQLREGRERDPEPDEVPRVGDAHRGAPGEPLDVAHPLEPPPDGVAGRRRRDERLDRVLALPDHLRIEERPEQPLAQEPGAHRRVRPVEGAEERRAELEGLDRGRVDRHGVGGKEALEPRQVAEGLAVGVPQVREGARGRLEPDRHARQAQGVERGDLEVGAERLDTGPEGEGRGIAEGQHGAPRGQAVAEALLLAERRRQEDLGRPADERRVDQLGAALADPELAGRDVREGEPERAPGLDERQQEVVGGALEEGGVRHGAGGDDPDDLATQELLAAAGSLHLLAEGNLLPRPDQPRDVRLGRVMGDARHLGALPGGERDLEQPGPALGVLEEHLVEVAEPKEQEVIGIAPLQLLVLLHHRRQRRRRPHGLMAARSRSQVASSASGSTFTSPSTAMKLVSPFQRGTTWTCRWPSTPAPATRPWLRPMLKPSGRYARRSAAVACWTSVIASPSSSGVASSTDPTWRFTTASTWPEA